MLAAVRLLLNTLILLFLMGASLRGADAAPLRSHGVDNSPHCGGRPCWGSHRHHGHSRYQRDAGDHVSFRIFHKKF